jgi:uncharacterized membrane protein
MYRCDTEDGCLWMRLDALHLECNRLKERNAILEKENEVHERVSNAVWIAFGGTWFFILAFIFR